MEVNEKSLQSALNTIMVFAKSIEEQTGFIASSTFSTAQSLKDFAKEREKKVNNEKATDNNGSTELIGKMDELIKEFRGENKKADEKKPDLDTAKISKFGSDILSFSRDVSKSLPNLAIVRTSIPFVTNTIANFTNSLTEKINVDDKKLESMGKFISTTLSGIYDFAKGIAKSIPFFIISKPFMGFITNSIADFITRINSKLKDTDSEEVMKNSKSLVAISSSILKFSGNLALAIPILLILTPALKLFNMVSGSVFTFVNTFADNADKVQTATGSINRISLSMVGFAAAVGASILILGGSTGKDFVGVGLMLLGMYGVTKLYSMIGSEGGNIGKGSGSILLMSLSIIGFAGSLALSTALLQAVSFKNIGLGLLTIGGFALVYSFIGKGEAAMQIGMASLAVGAMGLSLIAFAYPMKTFGEVLGKNPKLLWQLPLLLGGVGAIYTLAGVASEFIIPGALAFAAIGASLWMLSKAVKTYTEIPAISKEQASGISFTIKSMVSSISHSMDDISLWNKATLLPKIAMLTAMSAPLFLLGKGIESFLKYSGGWTNESGEKFKQIMGSLADGYSYVGTLADSTVENGISSTMKMGKNLKRLSEGIKEWAGISAKTSELAKQNIYNILTTIPQAFAQMKLGKVSFGGFGDSEMLNGIEDTMKIGKNLKKLADGVLAWKSITQPQVDLAKRNILAVLTALPSVFVKAYKSGGKAGMFGLGNNDLERGVNATMKMGKAVTSIGEFIKGFGDINDAKVGNVKSMITGVIGTIIGSIRGYTKKDNSLFESLNEQLDKLYEKFTKFNKEMKNHMNYLSKVDVKYIANFDKWVGTLERLANVDTTKIENVNSTYRRNQDLNNTLEKTDQTNNGGLVATGKKLIHKLGNWFSGDDKQQTVTKQQLVKTQVVATPTVQTNPQQVQATNSDAMIQQLVMQMAALNQLLSSVIQGGAMRVENVDANLNNMFLKK